MELLDTPLGLSADDALSLWVGRVARTHALLEYGVDNVHRVLLRRAERQANGKSVKGFDQLVTECIALLHGSDCGQQILTAGDSALRAAKQATSVRNRIVHDMWLPDHSSDESEQPRWNTLRRSGDLRESYNSATSQNLAVVIETREILLRTRLRVSGLFMALHEIWRNDGGQAEGTLGEVNTARYVALMTGHFVLHPNGDFDVA